MIDKVSVLKKYQSNLFVPDTGVVVINAGKALNFL